MNEIMSALIAVGIDETSAGAYSTELSIQGFSSILLFSYAEKSDLEACRITKRGHLRAAMKAVNSITKPQTVSSAVSPAVSSDSAHSDAQLRCARISELVETIAYIRQYIYVDGERVIDGCTRLLNLVHNMVWADDEKIDAGVCEVVSDVLRVWGGKNRNISFYGVDIARRLAQSGCVYAYRLINLDVPSLTLGTLKVYGKIDRMIANEGCALLKELLAHMGETRRKLLRDTGATDILKDVMDNDWKDDAMREF